MANAAISKPSLYQNNIIYTGTGASLGETGDGFQPDFTWEIFCTGNFLIDRFNFGILNNRQSSLRFL